jgi:hypothetical protein
MNPKTKSLTINTLLSAVLFLTLSASQASVETTQAPNGSTKTTIKVNGLSVNVLLSTGNAIGDTNGFLAASKDQIANTSALDFSYAFQDPANPDLAILFQGAGAIQNSDFTVTSDSAHLAVTTPFEVTRCVVNLIDGTFVCNPTTPIKFDLTWVRNGFATIFEKSKRIETLGPLTTRIQGEFTSRTASVNGTWDVFTADENLGHLVNTQSTTVIREITMEASP